MKSPKRLKAKKTRAKEAVKAWRAANPERYRAYMRELMRKRREEEK